MRSLRNLATAATVIAFTLTGCSGDRMTGTPDRLLQPRAPSASTSAERPWKAKCDVEAVFTSATTLVITGTCQFAHLGRTTVLEYQTIEAPEANGIIAFTNTATYTAANGDELRTSTIGAAAPTVGGVSLSGINTAVGGTGRFANASGTAALAGTVRFTGPTSAVATYRLDGHLSY